MNSGVQVQSIHQAFFKLHEFLCGAEASVLIGRPEGVKGVPYLQSDLKETNVVLTLDTAQLRFTHVGDGQKIIRALTHHLHKVGLMDVHTEDQYREGDPNAGFLTTRSAMMLPVMSMMTERFSEPKMIVAVPHQAETVEKLMQALNLAVAEVNTAQIEQSFARASENFKRGENLVRRHCNPVVVRPTFSDTAGRGFLPRELTA